jgi:hypothetical protein
MRSAAKLYRALAEHVILKVPSSHLAATAIMMTYMEDGIQWQPHMEKFCGYTRPQMNVMVTVMDTILKKQQQQQQAAGGGGGGGP